MAQTNFEKILTAWVTGWQTLQDAISQLLTLRSIDRGTGEQLDLIGRIVLQPRNGDVDADYRRRLRARISTNKSRGVPLDLFKICKLVVPEVGPRFVYRNEGNCHVIMTVADYALPLNVANILIEYLRLAVSAGVRLVLEVSEGEPEETFGFYESDGIGFATLPEVEIGTPNIVDTVQTVDPTPRTLQIVIDGSGTGSLTNVGDAWTFHAEDAVTTNGNFQAALTASGVFIVKTAGNPADLFFVDEDAFGPASFTASPVGGVLSSTME
jgi:hypothetical protein